MYGQAGDLIFKPRNQWHTFWNAGDEPARILEIISPAGLERYFEELSNALTSSAEPDPIEVGALAARYGLEFDIASVPRLIQEHGLRFGS